MGKKVDFQKFMQKVSLFKNIGYLEIVENISILGKGPKKVDYVNFKEQSHLVGIMKWPFRQDAQMVQVGFIEEKKTILWKLQIETVPIA